MSLFPLCTKISHKMSGISSLSQENFTIQLCGNLGVASMYFGDVLGSGGQGTVYKMVGGPAEANGKWYIKRHQEQRHFETEVDILTNLIDVSGVVKLEGFNEEMRTLVGSPICKNIEFFRGRLCVIELANQMVETLRFVHEKGIRHRDVRLGNLLVEVDAEGNAVKAIIADWATAVNVSEEQKKVRYEGAVHFAADAVLENLSVGERDFHFSAAMDLESLVKTVWDLFLRSPSGVYNISKENRSDILEWWKRRAQEDQRLAVYLKYARETDYSFFINRWTV